MAKKDSVVPTKKELISSRRAYISQSKIPKLTLSEAIRLAKCLNDDFNGNPTPPHQLAMKVDISPTSSNWPDLCGSSIAYGLTTGGYNAQTISLKDLGRRIVAPTIEGADVVAKVEASLMPEIPNKFFKKYNRSKFPQDRIARNVLAQMGVPTKRLDNILEILKRNGEFVGIIQQTKTGPFVAIDTPIPSSDITESGAEESKTTEAKPEQDVGPKTEGETIPPTQTNVVLRPKNNRVFISHGKNRQMVQQIKEILTFGKFEPIVSIERESLAVPVPDKVYDEMRSCSAGVIHVTKEGELLDQQGNQVIRINENVLIEIGAAIALYKKNFVLLVEKGVELPSTLQGLYRCEYEGDKLDYDATIKLLKTFNEFK